jgi:uncharacterized membrane protein
MGRVVSHPSAVLVNACDGTITLEGKVLSKELEKLLSVVAGVRGVSEVVSLLEAPESAERIPDLQGGQPRHFPPELLQENWAPSVRWSVGALAAGLVGFGLRRRGLPGLGAAALGSVLGTRAVTNLPWKRLTGIGAGPRAVFIQKTIHVRAPVEDVYRFWANLENLPKFLSHVREVRRLGARASHWRVDGPAGLPVEWDAELIRSVSNRLFAWKSRAGSPIQHMGTVHFDAEGGGTRIHLQMRYTPPGGAIGHALAYLVGADAKTELDEDLVRMKTYLETGRPARDAARR